MGENPSALGIAARTVGDDLWGAAGTAANAVANIPHAAVAAVDNFLQHAAGVEHPLPTHALEVTNTTPEMREFQEAVGRSPLIQNPVTQAVIGKAKELAAAHPVLTDVASDVANLLPAVGAARAVEGGVAGLSAARQAAADAAENTAAQTPVEIARAAGYKLKPTEAGDNVISRNAEGLSGSARLEGKLVQQNQQTTNRLAAEELGLDPDKPITNQALNRAKQPHNAVYDEVGRTLGTFPTDAQFQSDIAGIGNQRGLSLQAQREVQALKKQYALPDLSGPDAIAETKALRAQASKIARGPYDPVQAARGMALKSISDAIEAQMERQADALGDLGGSDLLDRWRAARTSLAKINNVQGSLVGSNVSAAKLAKAAARGAPLTGRLKLISDVASNFPNVTGLASARKGLSDLTVVDLLAGGLEGVKGVATAGIRPVVRGILGSDLVQNRFGPVARDLTGARLGEYFPRPAAADVPAAPGAGGVPFTAARGSPGALSPQVAHAANTLAGDLQLAPEAPGHGLPFEPSDIRLGDLTASAVPQLHGDIPFTSSEPLGTAMAGNLKLAQPAAGGGIAFRPTTPSPRAAGIAGDLALEQSPSAPQRPLALPAPTRGPIAVDQAGRAGTSPAEVAAHRQALGLDELGPGVRQPAAGPNPEREAAAASAAEAASTFRPPNAQAASRVLRQLAKQVKGNPSDGTKMRVQYANQVSPAVAAAFKQGGVDVTGFTHVVDADQVRHVFAQHGDAATELSRGQIPVTPDDFAKLPQIMESPDEVTPTRTTDRGLPAVLVKKQIGNDAYVVQEARVGRKQLAVTSMWKVGRRGQMPDLGAPASDLNVRDGGDTTVAESTTRSQSAPASAGKSVPRSTNQVLAQRSEPFSAHTVAHYADDAGQHIVRSRNGEASAQESGPYLRVERIDVNPASRGKGEATSMMERLLQAAQERGLTLGSDISVSPDQRKVYRALANRGWTVKQNPASISPTTKNLVSDDIRVPVYEVRAPKPRKGS